MGHGQRHLTGSRNRYFRAVTIISEVSNMFNAGVIRGRWLVFAVALAFAIDARPGLAQGQVAAQLEFEERCHLPQGEYLKRVLPPHPASRTEFLKSAPLHLLPGFIPNVADSAPKSLLLVWKDSKLTLVHAEPRVDYPLSNVVTRGMGLSVRQLRGSGRLLNLSVPGDIIIDGDADPKDVVAAIEHIIRDELKQRANLTVKTEIADALVARGNIDVKALATRKLRLVCHPEKTAAEDFAEVTRTGTWRQLLMSVADAAGYAVVDETPPSNELLTWTVVMPQPQPITNVADFQNKAKMKRHGDLMLRLGQEKKVAGPAALRQVTGAEINVEQRPIMLISFDEVRDSRSPARR
jgi:hypothetical protein